MATRCPYWRRDELLPADPCADYLSLRDAEPMRWDADLGVWIATGFDEVTDLLRHPALSSAWPSGGASLLHDAEAVRTADIVRRWFMFTDGAAHNRARRVVAPVFAADSVERTGPFIVDTVDKLLAQCGDRVDVMADLAVPLSGQVICHLLGLPAETAPRLETWAADIAALLVADYLPVVVANGDRTLGEISDVVATALASRDLRAGTGLARLRDARDAGQIDDRDILATASLLVFAGFETTSTFIGKGVRAVLHSGQWRSFASGTIDETVEELLRFDTSVQQVARIATATFEVAGHRVAQGDLVLLMLGVANRDPGVFTEPDRLSGDRRISRHLAFGQGVHYCLGANLARLEATILLGRLLATWQRAELAEAPAVRSHYGVKVLEHLVVDVGMEPGASGESV